MCRPRQCPNNVLSAAYVSFRAGGGGLTMSFSHRLFVYTAW
jgi:hypothetical protein